MTPKVRPLSKRLMGKVIPNGPQCWIWRGAFQDGGYPVIWDNSLKRNVGAHRAIYELYNGPISPGLHIDHLCRNPSCVNPWHLEPVTPRENTLRGISPPAQNAQKSCCVNGHPFDAKNTRVLADGSRQCRTCRQERSHGYYLRKKENQGRLHD